MKQKKSEMYRRHLVTAGYSPNAEEDGRILTFREGGGTFLIVVNEEDEAYFQVVFPNFWRIGDDDERQKALAAASAVTGMTKSAKVYLADDNTVAAVELFLPEPQQFAEVFERSMRALKSAVTSFSLLMNLGAVPGTGMELSSGGTPRF